MRFDDASGASSIADAETLQNVVAPLTARGPALRSCRSVEQTAAVRGVFTRMSPSFVLTATSFVSETVSPPYFGRSPFVAAVHVLVQGSAGAFPPSATYEPTRDV